MNYVLKRHPPNGILETFVNNANRSDRKSYICGHCLQRHALILNDARQMSTYVSALRLMLKRKQKLENCGTVRIKATNKVLLSGKLNDKKFTELVKVSRHNSKETRMKIQKIQPRDVSAFAEKPGLTFTYQYENNYGSTTTYDPTLSMPTHNAEKFDKNLLSDAGSDLSITDLNKKFGLKNATEIESSKSLFSTMTMNKYNQIALDIKAKCAATKDSGKRSVKNIDQDDINSSVLRMLPLSAVKILPMPKSVHETSKMSQSIKELTKSEDQGEGAHFLKPEVGHLNIEEPLLKSNIPDQDPKDDDWSSFFDKQYIRQLRNNVSPKEFSFMKFIHSYIDVSINNNMLVDALRMLQTCRKKETWKRSTGKYFVLEVYNTLLHGFSVQGDWPTVGLITEWMHLDRVKFNCQTYAALLDCLARVDRKIFQNDEFWKKEIIKVIKNLYGSHYSIHDLFSKTVLPKDKREKVLETIRNVLPYFEIEPTSIKLNSNCPLLKNLYDGCKKLESPMGQDASIDIMEKNVEEQLLIEKKFSVKVRAISKRYTNAVSQAQVNKFTKLNEDWREAIREGLIRKLKSLELEHTRSSKFNLYVFLKCLPVDTHVDIMMETVQTLLEFSGGYSPSTFFLYNSLGEKVYRRYEIQKKIDLGVFERTEKLFKKYCSWYVDPVGPARNSRQEWQMLIQDFMEGHHLGTKVIKWPDEVKGAVGKCLYDVILKNVKINLGTGRIDSKQNLVPAFYLLFRFKNVKRSEEIKCHPSVSNLFRKIGYDFLNFDANQIPMVCPPKPWMSVSHGGYLILPADFVRLPEIPCDKVIDFKRVPGQQLYATFDSLNALQAVPWIVNEKVLDVVLEVFRNGGSLELNIPKLPEVDPVKINITPDMGPEEARMEYNKKQRIMTQRQNEYGLWCETLYRLSLANHFRNRVFWLPQNFDFRGRVYPIPPHLNHLGADVFRSLLLFAKAKPLGPNGLNWLKIHTINLRGTHKRRSVRERLEYANHMLPEIVDSAEKPLTGKKWWAESEEPWQTLAACMEIKQALEASTPESYMTHFPVHQDGSCNGLQHYAALGRDTIGARSVNLAPGTEPQDVYSDVTKIIENKRIKDAENGVEIAKILDGFVRRKVLKQTIMTTVYGVTSYGAKSQIAGQLRDIPEFPDQHVWRAAIYLAEKTFESLQQMFTSAKEIQEWFIECARIICLKKEHVQWISPVGLPIMQPYAKYLKTRQSGSSKSIHLLVPNQMKQKNAFPPNFVHSLDSCHMMLTSLYCEQAGLTFASIHDCFWTHPSTVEVMNRICREQFICLHSQEILENLSRFFINLYVNETENKRIDEEAMKVFKAVPKTGDFDLESVLSSVYFFS